MHWSIILLKYNVTNGVVHALHDRKDRYGAGGLKPGSRLMSEGFKAKRTVVGVAYLLRS